ncbi:hypothetical protein JVU11DRAFT_5687 [Chiua virens]|nr:hypothetical protein JVU11DRAFT_5687 [Chiua virens]
MNNRLNLTICHPRLSSGKDANTAVLAKSIVPTALPANHVLIKVDRFGFSANNITYQALGEVPHFRYFDFHAVPEDSDSSASTSTHGVTPVWGFGTIVTSTHAAIQTGERVYGYFAPTRFLLFSVAPLDFNRYAFYVSRPHLPEDRRPYNQVTRCSTDPLYDPSPNVEDLTMLYRPLFWTSFWCEDWFHTSKYRGGASRILISSASAKTAFCLAYLIRKRAATDNDGRMSMRQVIGLTSSKNYVFTKNLGLYDHVLNYDEFESAPVLNEPLQKWIYIDVAGNEHLNARIFAHFSDTNRDLAGSVALGLTNLSPSSKSDSADKWTRNEFSQQKSPTNAGTVLYARVASRNGGRCFPWKRSRECKSRRGLTSCKIV